MGLLAEKSAQRAYDDDDDAVCFPDNGSLTATGGFVGDTKTYKTNKLEQKTSIWWTGNHDDMTIFRLSLIRKFYNYGNV